MKIHPKLTVKLLFLSIFTTSPVFAEERIGLVLGGGGAKGLAHIGVLQYLETHRIPVDFVVGTSMGALAGGLYAQGQSADDLTSLVRTVDWQSVFTDEAPRAFRGLRRKEEDRIFPTQALLGFSDGEFKFPSALIQGQRLMPLLRSYSINSQAISHFDALPIPFRATAVDIETGELLIIEQGDIALAMRASMAIPGIFSPVNWQGRYVVDGGMVNNLPVDLALEMGATTLIVVDVGDGFPPFEELQGPIEIMEQAINLMIRNNSQEQVALLRSQDIHIVPDLLANDIGAADFGKAEQAIQAGYAAAEKLSDKLLALQLSPSEWAEYKAQRLLPESEFEPQWFRLENESNIPDDMLWANIATEPGKPFDEQILNQDIERIYGLGYFGQVDYQVMWEDDIAGVEIRAVPKRWGPDYLSFGLTLEDNFDSQSSYRAAVSYLRTEVNSLGAELQFDLQVGNEPLFRAQYWQPLKRDASAYTNTRLRFSRNRVNNFDGNSVVAVTEVDRQSLGFDLGTQWRHTADIRFSVDFATGDIENLNTSVSEHFQTGAASLQVTFDTLDSVYLPREGHLFTLKHQWHNTALGADVEFQQITLQSLHAKSFGDHTLVAGVKLGSTTEGNAPAYSQLQLGGFMNLSGFERNALSGQHLAFGQFVYLKRIAASRQFGALPVYVGTALEAGNIWQSSDSADLNDLIYSGSLLGVVTTPIGALYLGLSHNSEDQTGIYLAVGRPF
ncbi:MAG: bifunctional autotransporter / phospholipase [Idiomarinaceae bacterium HL-53]|nr:MAG: bifunctional autotransporter / phospholipase [Idiomarinaceae bacterium HL-53]CUS47744.1 NTE family protein [Idiomarinaceae bacterium HL-53]